MLWKSSSFHTTISRPSMIPDPLILPPSVNDNNLTLIRRRVDNQWFMSLHHPAWPRAHLVQLDEGVTWAAHTLSQVSVSEAAPHPVAIQVLGGQVEVVLAVHTGPDHSHTHKKKKRNNTQVLGLGWKLHKNIIFFNRNMVLFCFLHTSVVNQSHLRSFTVWFNWRWCNLLPRS